MIPHFLRAAQNRYKLIIIKQSAIILYVKSILYTHYKKHGDITIIKTKPTAAFKISIEIDPKKKSTNVYFFLIHCFKNKNSI